MVFFPSNYSGFQFVGNNINLLVLFILNNNIIFPNRIPTKQQHTIQFNAGYEGNITVINQTMLNVHVYDIEHNV